MNLSANEITTVPFLWGDIECLESVVLENNPLSGDFKTLYEKRDKKTGKKGGWIVVKSYLREGLEKGVSVSKRVRLLVVGHEHSGKSSLIDSVTLPPSRKESFTSTVLGKKHLVRSRGENERTWMVEPQEWEYNEVSYRILDFPGQPEFYATNNFFFSSLKDSAVILVVRLYPTDWALSQAKDDASKQKLIEEQLSDSSNQLKFWLSIISDNACHMQRESGDPNGGLKQKVLIVATCGDLIDKSKLKEWLSKTKKSFSSFTHVSVSRTLVVNALDRIDVESVRNNINDQAQEIFKSRYFFCSLFLFSLVFILFYG